MLLTARHGESAPQAIHASIMMPLLITGCGDWEPLHGGAAGDHRHRAGCPLLRRHAARAPSELGLPTTYLALWAWTQSSYAHHVWPCRVGVGLMVPAPCMERHTYIMHASPS